MNRIYLYIGGVFSMIALFTLLYYVSYQTAYQKLQKESYATAEQQDTSAKEDKGAGVNEPSVTGKAVGESAVSVDTVKEELITNKTECIMETYSDTGRMLDTNTIKVPAELIGCNREEVLDYVVKYMQDIPLEEYLDGLVSYELISFSGDKVRLRKTYDLDGVQFRYYLLAKNGEVVVYYSDKRTVYEYTGIQVENLTKEDQTELSYGILVTDDKELYSILENYSS